MHAGTPCLHARALVSASAWRFRLPSAWTQTPHRGTFMIHSSPPPASSSICTTRFCRLHLHHLPSAPPGFAPSAARSSRSSLSTPGIPQAV
eukprot:scaffold825_cov249-Pinguiococcus_pyrenoidosus.AAC.65